MGVKLSLVVMIVDYPLKKRCFAPIHRLIGGRGGEGGWGAKYNDAKLQTHFQKKQKVVGL